MKPRFFGIAAIVALTASATVGAPAASSGMAWDSVTRIQIGADTSSLQPGNFDADYANAAAVQAQDESAGGGLMGKFKQAMNMGKNMQQLMKNGFAERHYVAGSKERIDDVAYQTATITDCVARTITKLDLRVKTYRVISMDQPSTPESTGGGGPQGSSKNDIASIAVVVTNTALGQMQVAGQFTNGYRSDMTFTETKTTGEAQTQNGNLLGYYTSYATPHPACARPAMGGGPSHAGPGFSGYAQLLQGLAAAGMDKRFSIKQSGPALPLGRFSMYDAMSFSTSGRSGAFVVERGNVRSIGADDPVFSVPSDFTRQQ